VSGKNDTHKKSFRQPDKHFMVVLNHGCEDFLPIRFPQSGDVGFEIVQTKPHVADHASPDIAQVGPVFRSTIQRSALGDMSPSGVVEGGGVAHEADVMRGRVLVAPGSRRRFLFTKESPCSL
jgi:hypothetical protein